MCVCVCVCVGGGGGTCNGIHVVWVCVILEL